MRNWHDRAIELNRLYSYNRTAEMLQEEFQDKSITYNAVRNYIRRHPTYCVKIESKNDLESCGNKESLPSMSETVLGSDCQATVSEIVKEELTINADGTRTYDEIEIVMSGTDITPEEIMRRHGLDVGAWRVVNYKSNKWNGLSKTGKTVQRQTKLTVKPLIGEISFADIDRYFAEKKFESVKPLSNAYNYDPNGEVLEVACPDLHSGLMSWRRETGQDYDLHIAKERFMTCISDVVNRCQGRKFKGIVFATLGDLMHIDNDNQTTTKGTFQQADGRTAKIFDFTLDMLIDAVTMLAEIAPVEFVYVSGNHARTLEYPLVKALEMAFKHDRNVRFDVEPNPQKAKLIGCNLIGYTHGDMAKTNMRGWLQSKFREAFGKARHVEIHAGHFHTDKTVEIKQTTDNEGMTVRYLPTICASSYWEHQQGYADGERAVVSFVWNTETGLREMWYSSI